MTSTKTLIEREFDPEAIRQLKAKAGADLSVGGAALAAQAIKAGLVDEYQLFLVPVVVGGGKRALPGNDVRVNLELLDEAPVPQRHGLPPLPHPELRNLPQVGAGGALRTVRDAAGNLIRIQELR